MPKMNGAKRSIKAVGCQNELVRERSALEGRTCTSSAGQSGSENVGLSNANVGENPMPRKPKGSSASKFWHWKTSYRINEAQLSGNQATSDSQFAGVLVLVLGIYSAE
ncbi:unnamed protein product [Sphenostylis stenocarpa]|uniref:Uncharacterized protein n=1 Tax=Sphenostylis stenocarpa TaxID=92480 RepID=A0AA86VS55_9FABA|nr:unnamed protein product [Sphenostylis stenocarpa]